jgi:hypothetical protein
MKLTARQVDTSKPKDKPYKLSDGGGLYLLVNPNGSRYWRLKYRIAGKEKLLALGVYPDITLAEARQKRADAKRFLLLVVIRDRRSRKRNKRKSRLWQTALSAWLWNGIPIKAHRGQKAMPSIS